MILAPPSVHHPACMPRMMFNQPHPSCCAGCIAAQCFSDPMSTWLPTCIQVEIVAVNSTADIVQDLGDVCNRQVRCRPCSSARQCIARRASLSRSPRHEPDGPAACQILWQRAADGCVLAHAQVYVINSVLIPVRDLADAPQTIPAGETHLALAMTWVLPSSGTCQQCTCTLPSLDPPAVAQKTNECRLVCLDLAIFCQLADNILLSCSRVGPHRRGRG